MLCLQLEFQDTQVQLNVAGVGAGAEMEVGFNGVDVDDQSPLTFGGCGTFFIGACAATQPIQNAEGDWTGAGGYYGLTTGMEVSLGASYNFWSYDTETHKVTLLPNPLTEHMNCDHIWWC